MSDLEAAALRLAEEGNAVFPLDGEKRPRTKNGFHDATSDPKLIAAWDWSSAEAIGIAIPEGQFVVDVDPRNGGEESAKALAAAGFKLTATRVHSTRGGGTHRFYRLPDGMSDRKLRGTLGPGIDIKASGKGYVVAPPSPGYTVKFDREPAQAPEWMVAQIVKDSAPPSSSQPSTSKFFTAWEQGTPYGMSALEKEIGRLLMQEEGGRNNALNRAAFALAQLAAGGEISEAECLSRLALAGERMGLAPDEVEATVQSGWSAGSLDPRQAAPRESFSGPAPSFAQTERPDRQPEFTPSSGVHDVNEHYWLDWENADDTPPPFYLHPLIPKNAYVLVYGATEASKSMTLMALAVEGSHRGIKSTIYSLENPSHIDIDRVRRLGPDANHFRITNQFLDLADARQLQEMVAREKSWPDGGSTDWLIIDTYSHAFNSRSEDGNAKAIEFARRVRWLMSEVGCTVIVLDHTGYADHGEPRDASAKRQQVDVAIRMDRTVPWAPGQPSKFSAENKKSARFGNPFFLRGSIEDVKPGRGLRLTWDRGQAIKWQEPA